MRYKKKPKPKKLDIVIVYDDRERHPWALPWPMERKRLKVGDYSIKGFEDVIAIEKKSGFAELFSNLTGKERPRFDRFLKRLSKYPVKCIIIEDELSSLYAVWNLMKLKAPKTRLTPNTILYWVSKIIVEYKIPILFVPKGWRLSRDIITELFNQCKTNLEKPKCISTKKQ